MACRIGYSVWAPLIAIAALCAPGASADEAQAAVERVVGDYVGLYASSTLERWKALFHPSLTVASPKEDGTVQVRGLDEFYEAQRSYLASGREISERLEGVRIEMGRRIARVSADFVLVEGSAESAGKLGLHLVEGRDGWQIAAVVFAYDEP